MGLRTLTILMLICLGGCVSPVKVDAKASPELAKIRDKFQHIVQTAHADENVEWVHGWSGNSAIAETGQDGTIMGYCYEWQELVYDKIKQTVKELEWDLVKININRDVFSEHHAVVVYDPKVISQKELLTRFEPAWVLDAWQEGKADIFSLEEWLSIPVIVFEAAALEVAPETYWRPGN